MLDKAPEVTPAVRTIKILAVTVGETAADFLNFNLEIGLANTSLVMSALLAAVLAWQFRTRRCVPGVCWLAILFTLALGTAAGDLAAETFQFGYLSSTLVFAAAIGATALACYGFRAHAIAAFWVAYILTRPPARI